MTPFCSDITWVSLAALRQRLSFSPRFEGRRPLTVSRNPAPAAIRLIASRVFSLLADQRDRCLVALFSKLSTRLYFLFVPAFCPSRLLFFLRKSWLDDIPAFLSYILHLQSPLLHVEIELAWLFRRTEESCFHTCLNRLAWNTSSPR